MANRKRSAKDVDIRYWGIFPYRWNVRKAFQDIWNPKEPRLFPPKQFGIGWGLNVFVLWTKAKDLSRRIR